MRSLLVGCAVTFAASFAHAQMPMYDNLASYCEAVSQIASPVLVARTQGIPRSEAEALMQGMTDPVAIRMVKEEIEFAYSRPVSQSIERLRTELKGLCLAKKIFVQ